MAFWYSVRLRRRRVSVRPGFGLVAVSSLDSRVFRMARRSVGEGCGALGGGMVPVRSLRTTFSQSSGCRCGLLGSAGRRFRLPLFRVLLWQGVQ